MILPIQQLYSAEYYTSPGVRGDYFKESSSATEQSYNFKNTFILQGGLFALFVCLFVLQLNMLDFSKVDSVKLRQ